MNEIVAPMIKELTTIAADYVDQDTVAPIAFQGYQDYLDQGNRLNFEDQYFERRRQLAVLALAYHCQPTVATKRLLENVIWEVCNEYSWGLPAHMPLTGATYGLGSSQWIDLFAAETGATLAEIQGLIGSDLLPEINQRIDLEIERRILTPFAAHDWSWQHKANNWSAVIGGSLGLIVLIKLPKDSPRQRAFLQRLDIALQTYLNSFSDDGACVEGVSYWAYGFGYYLYFAEKMRAVLNDDRYLKNPKVAKIAAFPYLAALNQKDFVPFSDYAESELPSGLLCFCQREFGVAVPPITTVNRVDFDTCYRFAQLYRNLIWTDRLDTAATTLPSSTHYFPDVQWLIERNNESDFIFAAKGGANDESHNHLDLGHFILGDQSTQYLTDLGSGEYTRDYFQDERRYQYFIPSAPGHSLPVINGQAQIFGPYHAQTDFKAQENRLLIDLSHVYGKEAGLLSFQRQFKVSPAERQVQLCDRFEFQQDTAQVTEILISALKPQLLDPQTVLLQAASGACQISLIGAQLSFVPVDYANHLGKTVRAYQIRADYQLARAAQVVIKFQLQTSAS